MLLSLLTNNTNQPLSPTTPTNHSISFIRCHANRVATEDATTTYRRRHNTTKTMILTFSFWRKSAPQSAHMSFITVVWMQAESRSTGVLEEKRKHQHKVRSIILMKSQCKQTNITHSSIILHTILLHWPNQTYSALTVAPSLYRRFFTTPTLWAFSL